MNIFTMHQPNERVKILYLLTIYRHHVSFYIIFKRNIFNSKREVICCLNVTQAFNFQLKNPRKEYDNMSN